jgi:hypothetical protein
MELVSIGLDSCLLLRSGLDGMLEHGLGMERRTAGRGSYFILYQGSKLLLLH